MKKNLLCCALLGAMAFASAASAQNYDDRWYISGTVGLHDVDDARGQDNDMLAGLGVGKMISPKWSLELELDRTITEGNGFNWDLTALQLVARRHYLRENRSNWHHYFAVGVGAQGHNEEYLGMVDARDGTDLLLRLGAGLQADLGDRVDLRTEVGIRADFDDNSVFDPSGDGFIDAYATVSALVHLGPPPAAPVAPAVVEKTCADLDDDGDGVNNCNDKCPNSAAGQAIGPDGCPVPLTIDLKGVNFDFDRDELRPDAVAILNEAVSILQKYPQLRVEVAGHTDSIGTEEYNQGLSERRARVVYDFLTSNGIDASRLVGPNGFGELRPIDTNDTREGRARNRRTELNVQN